MIRSIALFLIVCFILASLPKLALARSHPVRDEGYLSLQTKHKGLEVQVDGQFVGYTSDEVITLTEGTHKVTVRHPDRSNWLDEDWFANVRIQPGDTLRVPVVFKKSYSINSRPYGASVYLEDEYIGETPIYFQLLENEVGKVRISKSGFKKKVLTVGDSEQQFFDVTLKRKPTAVDTTVTKKGDDLQDSNFKVYLYSAIGLAAVSGGLALYFRNEANNKFDQYQNTGDPELFETFFDDAERYDRYAAISFGVFQASFIASFYLLLKEANR